MKKISERQLGTMSLLVAAVCGGVALLFRRVIGEAEDPYFGRSGFAALAALSVCMAASGLPLLLRWTTLSPAHRWRTAVARLATVPPVLATAALLAAPGEGFSALDVALLAFALHPATLELNVLVHEGGHALCALALGNRVLGFRASLVQLEPGPEGLRLGLNRSAVATGPQDAVRFALRGPRFLGRLALVTAGGPLANLLFAAGLGALSLRLDAQSQPLATAALWSLCGMGLLFGLLNLVPFRLASGNVSDGKLIHAALSREGAHLEPLLIRFAVFQEQLGLTFATTGIPASELGELAARNPERPYFALQQLILLLELGERARARTAADALWRALGPGQAWSADVLLHATALAALLEGDRAEAERCGSDWKRGVSPEYDALVDALLSFTRGELAQARSHLARFQELLAPTAPSLLARTGTRWIRNALNKALAS